LLDSLLQEIEKKISYYSDCRGQYYPAK